MALTCTVTTSALAVGTRSLVATYGGDADHTGATSVAFTQTVTQAASTTTIASSANPSIYGTGVTFTVSVSAGDGIPTGTVAVSDGSTAIGTCTLSAAGSCTVATRALTVGSHSIAATYSGDVNRSAKIGRAHV